MTRTSLPEGSATRTAPEPIEKTDSGDRVHLTAVLADAHGVPTAHARVQFFEFTAEFSPKGQLVALGRAVTDANGAARLTDQPTVTGTRRFVVTYTANPKAEPASAKVDVVVTTAHPHYQPAPAKPRRHRHDPGRCALGDRGAGPTHTCRPGRTRPPGVSSRPVNGQSSRKGVET